MGKFFSFVKSAVTAAAMMFSVLKLSLGNAPFADFGVATVSTDLLSKLLPALAAVLFPILQAKWPAIASFAKLIYDIFVTKNPATASALQRTAALEAFAIDTGNEAIRGACQTIRDELMPKPESSSKSAATAK